MLEHRACYGDDLEMKFKGIAPYKPGQGGLVAAVTVNNHQELWSLENDSGIEEVKRVYLLAHGRSDFPIELLRKRE